MILRITAAYEALRKLEEEYQVDVVSKGGAYGGSRLVIKDRETREEFDVDRLERGQEQYVPITEGKAGPTDSFE